VPDSILRKPGPLNEAERRLIETHTVVGEQMLEGVAFLDGEGRRIVRSHHERWDGAGYPDRFRGEEIPPGARIFAVADTLDAMTSDRPYRGRFRGGWRARRSFARRGRSSTPGWSRRSSHRRRSSGRSATSSQRRFQPSRSAERSPRRSILAVWTSS